MPAAARACCSRLFPDEFRMLTTNPSFLFFVLQAD
jgi:hypothetical protein